MITYANISPEMVNPRDIAGNAEDEEDWFQGHVCFQTFFSVILSLTHGNSSANH